MILILTILAVLHVCRLTILPPPPKMMPPQDACEFSGIDLVCRRNISGCGGYRSTASAAFTTSGTPDSEEVIKYMEAQGDEGATSVQLDTTNPSGVSEQSTDQTSSDKTSTDKMLVVRPQQPQCHLQ